jgi:protein-arginine kinase activator protein McsA
MCSLLNKKHSRQLGKQPFDESTLPNKVASSSMSMSMSATDNLYCCSSCSSESLLAASSSPMQHQFGGDKAASRFLAAKEKKKPRKRTKFTQEQVIACTNCFFSFVIFLTLFLSFFHFESIISWTHSRNASQTKQNTHILIESVNWRQCFALANVP